MQLKAGNNLVYIKLERIYLSAEKPERVTTCYGVNIVREKTASEDANEIEDRTVIYTSSLAEVGQKNVYLTVPWGWNLFKGNSTVFDERLAFVSLTLSRAADRIRSRDFCGIIWASRRISSPSITTGT